MGVSGAKKSFNLIKSFIFSVTKSVTTSVTFERVLTPFQSLALAFFLHTFYRNTCQRILLQELRMLCSHHT